MAIMANTQIIYSTTFPFLPQSKYSGLEVSTGRLMDHHLAYKQGIEAALAAMGESFNNLKEAAV